MTCDTLTGRQVRTDWPPSSQAASIRDESEPRSHRSAGASESVSESLSLRTRNLNCKFRASEVTVTFTEAGPEFRQDNPQAPSQASQASCSNIPALAFLCRKIPVPTHTRGRRQRRQSTSPSPPARLGELWTPQESSLGTSCRLPGPAGSSAPAREAWPRGGGRSIGRTAPAPARAATDLCGGALRARIGLGRCGFGGSESRRLPR